MKMMRPVLAGLLLLLIGLALALPAAPAIAQDANLSRELERLSRDLKDLQRYVYKGGKARPGGAGQPAGGSEVVSRMQLQITQMQSQLRTINGKVEQVQHGLNLMEKRLDRMASDLELRLTGIEDAIAGGAVSAAASPAAPSGGAAGSESPPGGVSRTASIKGYPRDGSSREQYDFAFDLLKNREYASAGKALRVFLEINPEDPLRSNALYWLGETRYKLEDYKDAARIFLEGFNKYPEGAKAPDNLLKLGMSMGILFKQGKLESADSACKTFAKLLSSFPKAVPRILRTAKSERNKLKCR